MSNEIISEQVKLLRHAQKKILDFPQSLHQCRTTCAAAEQKLSEAKATLEQAKATAASEALNDPKKADALTSEVKRKAAAEAGIASSLEVKSAQSSLFDCQRHLNSVQSDLELLRDQRRAVEYSQTAAIAILQIYQTKGEDHDSSPSSPARYQSGYRG